MKINRFIYISMLCVLFPFALHANSVQNQLERIAAQAVSKAKTNYYVPLVQLVEDDNSSTADGAEGGIFWVEIGSSCTADGYEPEFFYLISDKKVDFADGEGPVALYEPIVARIFNEAYKRFASDPRSATATVDQTRQLLTQYYRQIQAEQKK